jgi:hypothetical protein
MISSSAKDWKVGERGITKEGELVTIKEIVSGRYLKIKENLEKKIYIPAHGEIMKLTSPFHPDPEVIDPYNRL